MVPQTQQVRECLGKEGVGAKEGVRKEGGRKEGEREGKREGGNLTELQISTVTVQKEKERVKVQHCFE